MSRIIRIRQATKKGYVEVDPGMVFDFAYPDSKLRRGRLQFARGGVNVIGALTASNNGFLYYESYNEQPNLNASGSDIQPTDKSDERQSV